MKKQATSVLFLFIVLIALGSSTQIFPKHLYVYWHTPMETAPLLIQLCVQKMQWACDQSNWNFTVLNDTNLADHLPNYQEKYLPVANAAKHPGWKASVADLIRLAIIQEKGGMYLDISTILFRGLKWLERLEDFPYLLTNSEIHKGKFPDVLQSYFMHYQNIVQSRDPDHGITNIEPGYESWCFIAKPKAKYITALRNRHAHHYTNTEWDNKVEDFEKDYYLRGVFSDYLNNQKSAYEVIQQTQFQLDKNLTLFGQRANVNHHFNLVGFRAEYGPFPFLINLVAMQKVYTHTLEEIYEEDKNPLFFFMKMTSQDRPFVQKQLASNVELAQKYNNMHQNFDRFLEQMPSAEMCRELKIIVEGSVMSHLIKNSKISVEQKLSAISVEQRQRWWNYCEQVHNVTQNWGLSPDGRVEQVFNEWVLAYSQYFLSEERNNKLRQILNKIAIFCAYSNHGYYGGFSDVQQTYYWRKVFEERNPQIQNATPDPYYQYRGTRQLKDYSFWQITKLRIELYLFANRTPHAYKLKIFILFLVFTCVLAALFLGLTVILKIVRLLWKCIISQNQRKALFEFMRQVPQKMGNYWQRLSGNSNGSQQSSFLKSIALLLIKYWLKRYLTFLLCLAYIAYNAIVAFEYFYVLYLGKIYFQEFNYILFILIQFLFRKTFQKIGLDQWAIPGLTLGQMHRIFVPVYIMSLGASIANMAERTQVQNWALSASISLILPVFIKEFDHQFKKVNTLFNFNRIAKTIQIPQLKMTVQAILKILLNFTNSVEIAVLLFLGINVIMPNLRFIVHNDEVYAVKKFFHSMEGLVQFFFIALLGLYIAELWKKIKNIQEPDQLYSESGQRQSMNSETQMKKMSGSFGKYSLSDDEGSLNRQGSEMQKSWSIIVQLLTVFLQFIYYSFKVWVFYWMAYTRWGQILIRNTFDIAISQQMPGIQWYTPVLKVIAILIIYFVSWQLERVIEQVFDRVSSGQGVKQGRERGLCYMDLKEDADENVSPVYNRAVRTSRKASSSMHWFVLISLTVFLIPRCVLLNKIFQYLMAIDKKETTLKDSLEGEFYNIIYATWVITACAFKLIKQVISSWNTSCIYNDKMLHIEDQSNQYSPTTEYLNGQNIKEVQTMERQD